ncbi:hypothetical protein C2845_PM17G02890 [Panicum miliaceum]|uniref:PIR2-like helical domain-containing protein n=1 Tax=Panicum miliaceum TaxID=4540 RepID=A0A3L6Q2C1_PANMI|nr:hypothetical protein C2845_PM17G02890 [Panicum miliaceum]
MGDGAASSVLRVVRPQYRDMPYRKEQDDELACLLSKIDSSYAEACDRLAVRGRPVTLARFLDAGVCIGLHDLVSNIMANTTCTSDLRPDLREKVLVGAAVERKLDDLCRRSLEGLVAFLVYFFPYLAGWEAVRYLLLANADLLAAAHLIVVDRGMKGFSFTSPASVPAFEAALAAEVAKHPQPERLVRAWMSLSSRLHQVLALLHEVQHHSPRESTERLRHLLSDDPVVPPCLAIPCLLRAGYCYGPMDDPASNIILNTIWYEANFPAEINPVLDMIGPKSLTRLVSRSFYGLVSFLQTRYHNLSEHQAVQCLVSTCGQLCAADPNFCAPGDGKAQQHVQMVLGASDIPIITKVEQQVPSATIQEAYEAAATAAWHPNPEQQATFLTSWEGDLHREGKFSLEEVQHLCSALSPK